MADDYTVNYRIHYKNGVLEKDGETGFVSFCCPICKQVVMSYDKDDKGPARPCPHMLWAHCDAVEAAYYTHPSVKELQNTAEEMKTKKYEKVEHTPLYKYVVLQAARCDVIVYKLDADPSGHTTVGIAISPILS